MPGIAVAIRMMYRQKCGNRLPWLMITPHIDEINEKNPEGDRGHRKLLAGFYWRLAPFWRIAL